MDNFNEKEDDEHAVYAHIIRSLGDKNMTLYDWERWSQSLPHLDGILHTIAKSDSSIFMRALQTQTPENMTWLWEHDFQCTPSYLLVTIKLALRHQHFPLLALHVLRDSEMWRVHSAMTSLSPVDIHIVHDIALLCHSLAENCAFSWIQPLIQHIEHYIEQNHASL